MITQLALIGDPVPLARPCRRCHRRLTDPSSVALGIGPVCRRRVPTSKEPPMPDEPTADAPESSPAWFGWYDPDPKRPTADKIAAAIARFRDKHGHDPTALLLHPGQREDLPEGYMTEYTILHVQSSHTVPLNTFYLS